MLRTTISKISVCALTLVPRILRGEGFYVTNGFQRLSTGIRIRSSSTTSDSNDKNKCEKCKRIIELAFGPEKSEESCIDKINGISEPELPSIQEETATQMVSSDVKTLDEIKCYRTIEKIFGTDSSQHEIQNEFVSAFNQNKVMATTAKENEEKLAQKIETIDETPLVEAAKTKVEGFNTKPRVLGDKGVEIPNVLRDEVMSFTSFNKTTNKYDLQKSGDINILDELAQQCLGTPSSQLDDQLLKEMERLGISKTLRKKDTMPTIEEELMQMDVSKKPSESAKSKAQVGAINWAAKNLRNKEPLTWNFGANFSNITGNSDSTQDKLPQEPKKHNAMIEIKETTEIVKETPSSDSNNRQVLEEEIMEQNYSKHEKSIVSKELSLSQLGTVSGERSYIEHSLHVQQEDIDNLLNEYKIPCHLLADLTVVAQKLSESDEATDEFLKPERIQANLMQGEINIMPKIYLPSPDTLFHFHNIPLDCLDGDQAIVPESFSSRESVLASTATNLTSENLKISNETSWTYDNQVLIDPYDKKTLAYDSEKYEYDNALNSKSLEQSVQDYYQHVIPYSEIPPITSNESSEPVYTAETSRLTHVETGNYVCQGKFDQNQAAEKTLQEQVQIGNYDQQEKRDPNQAERKTPLEEVQMKYVSQEKDDSSLAVEKSPIEKVQMGNYDSQEKVESSQAAETNQLKQNIKEQYTEHKKLDSNQLKTRNDCQTLIQPEAMVTPLIDKGAVASASVEVQSPVISKALPNLEPKLDEKNVSLSELLKRVRLRNRMENCREFVFTSQVTETDPLVGSCGKPSPPCPPCTPQCPPKPLGPSACPKPKPKPKPCKPKCPDPCETPKCPPPPKKNPCEKFKKHTCATMDEALELILSLGPQMSVPFSCTAPVLVSNLIVSVETPSCKESLITDDIVSRFQILGQRSTGMLLYTYFQNAIEDLAIKSSKTCDTPQLDGALCARDYEPWTPIPSWPIPIKEKKKKLVCPKEGCKTPPPRLNPPCPQNPCAGLPKRTFSIIDLFLPVSDIRAIFLGEI